jgi:chromosome partitioning protein
VGAVTTPDDELAERGRAIFERLRATSQPAEGEADDDGDGTQEDEGDREAMVAVVDGEQGGEYEADDADPAVSAVAEATPEESPVDPDAPAADPGASADEAAPAGDPDAPAPAADEAAPTADTAADFRAPLLDAALEDAEAALAASAPAADAANPFVRPLPRVLAIANQKGGVGKTTTAVNLGAALAELGYRVLVIDLDPQGNATTGLGINPRNLEASVYDVIMHESPLEDCIEPTSLRNLFVVPATIDLAGAEIELVPAFSRELKLRKALEAVLDDFDFCLIDCPPSLGLITVNGLAAATEVVVPIQCEYYALEGLGQLLRNVNLVQGNLNPRLEMSAIILTMYDARTKLADQVAAEVRSHFGAKVCRNIVPRTVRLSEAPSFGQPIIVFDPSSRGAIAYRELAREVSGGAARRAG